MQRISIGMHCYVIQFLPESEISREVKFHTAPGSHGEWSHCARESATGSKVSAANQDLGKGCDPAGIASGKTRPAKKRIGIEA